MSIAAILRELAMPGLRAPADSSCDGTERRRAGTVKNLKTYVAVGAVLTLAGCGTAASVLRDSATPAPAQSQVSMSTVPAAHPKARQSATVTTAPPTVTPTPTRKATTEPTRRAIPKPTTSRTGSSLTGKSCHVLTNTSNGPVIAPGTYGRAGTCITVPGPVHTRFTYENADKVKRPASSGEVQLCYVEPAAAKAAGLICP